MFLKDDEIIYGKKYTREEKQEFIDANTFDYHQAYEAECKDYDNGDRTVFDNDNLRTYLFNLSFECHLYHQDKGDSVKEIIEGDYPISLDEFTEKVTEELVKDCHDIYGDDRQTTLDDLNRALGEDSTLISSEYRKYCDTYDKTVNRDEMPKNYPFNDVSNAVYNIRMWLYF